MQPTGVRVLQLVSRRRSSVSALIRADGRDCLPWLSEGHSGAKKTYLVKGQVVGDGALTKLESEKLHLESSLVKFNGARASLVGALALIHACPMFCAGTRQSNST